MMKKLTKTALLAAATAFLLAGVTACFTSVNDDEATNDTNSGGNTTVGESGGGTTSSGGGASNGATTTLTGKWTALDYAPTDTPTGADKDIDSGTALGAVTVEGSGAVWKPNSSTAATSWKHLNTGKAEKGCLKFTIAAESKIVVSASSGNADKTADIVLCTATDGTTGKVTGSADSVTNKDYEDVTYETVPAGTYYLGAFPATTNSRGVRIASITVTAK